MAFLRPMGMPSRFLAQCAILLW